MSRSPAIEVLLAEYGALRQEMLHAMETQRLFILLAVSSLGAIGSLAIQQNQPEIFLAVPFVLFVSFQVWLSNQIAIASIGYYFMEGLNPQIVAAGGCAMEWEQWTRRPDVRERFGLKIPPILFLGLGPTLATILPFLWVIDQGLEFRFLALWICAGGVTVWSWVQLLQIRSTYRDYWVTGRRRDRLEESTGCKSRLSP